MLFSEKQCTSDVPQGSVLSPILFLIYIDDFPDCIKHSTDFFYADDVKFLKTINCLLDCILLQQDLDTVAAWCSTWQLSLNVAKFLYIRFELALKMRVEYTISGIIVFSSVDSIYDLGIPFDSKLTFSSHCHKVAVKGFARGNMLQKCFYSNDYNL